MPAKRLLMRQIRDVLRLKHVSLLSNREIGRVLGVSYSTVAKYLDRAADLGLSWPLPEDLDDPALERRLFRHAVGYSQRPLPDWAKVHAELKRSGVTLRLLWEEYRERHPDGYGQSRFFALYRLWRGRTAPSMRQRHVSGEKLFVDYAGQTVEIVDMTTGEVQDAQIFVAALGASNYTFAEASWSQQQQYHNTAHLRWNQRPLCVGIGAQLQRNAHPIAGHSATVTPMDGAAMKTNQSCWKTDWRPTQKLKLRAASTAIVKAVGTDNTRTH